jgi:hypothetical protein
MTENQFSLRAAFIATALVAIASLSAKYGVTGPNVFYLLAVPVLIGAAVGTLAGNVGLWIRYGVQADIVLTGLVVLDLLIRTR